MNIITSLLSKNSTNIMLILSVLYQKAQNVHPAGSHPFETVESRLACLCFCVLYFTFRQNVPGFVYGSPTCKTSTLLSACCLFLYLQSHSTLMQCPTFSCFYLSIQNGPFFFFFLTKYFGAQLPFRCSALTLCLD